MTRIPVVNEADEVIVYKEREDVSSSDIDRVSALWLTNDAGDVLMAQRSFTKKRDPGVWGPAVGGTVEEGEDYDSNIIKEVKEEIGLTLTRADLTLGPKMLIQGQYNRYFLQWYHYTLNSPANAFTIQKEEVEQVQWFAPEAVKVKFQEHPEHFVTSADSWIKAFL